MAVVVAASGGDEEEEHFVLLNQTLDGIWYEYYGEWRFIYFHIAIHLRWVDGGWCLGILFPMTLLHFYIQAFPCHHHPTNIASLLPGQPITITITLHPSTCRRIKKFDKNRFSPLPRIPPLTNPRRGVVAAVGQDEDGWINSGRVFRLVFLNVWFAAKHLQMLDPC